MQPASNPVFILSGSTEAVKKITGILLVRSLSLSASQTSNPSFQASSYPGGSDPLLACCQRQSLFAI